MAASTSTSPTTTTSDSASTTPIKRQNCNVLIAGGGPAGLAAALCLARRGYSDIHILERNPSASYFEVDKSYLYRIDGRGQRLTGLLGITEQMKEVSITTEEFLDITIVQPDGTVKTVKAPADPSQQTAYWLPRRALLSFLSSQIDKEDCGKAITFHFGVNIEKLVMPRTQGEVEAPGAQATVQVRMGDGTRVEFLSQKVLGCDGMNSKIRTGLADWAAGVSGEAAGVEKETNSKKSKTPRFGLHFINSPSAGLRYKILTLLDDFPLLASTPQNLTVKQTCYSYVGRPTGGYLSPLPPLRLGLLPFKMKNIPRTANIITVPNAPIFSLTTGPEVLAFLKKELPQCDIDRMVSKEEADRFAASPGGYFPRPQYCLETQVVLGGGKERWKEGGMEEGKEGGGIVLMGDAIHAFPPDLGAGVNIALLDVLDFIFALDRSEGDWGQALPLYENLRAPQSRAVCELIPIGFPQQYNHMLPIQKSIKLLGVGMRVALSKAFPWVVAPPVFFMCQDVRLDYSQVWQRARRTTRVLKAVGMALVAAMVWQLWGGRGGGRGLQEGLGCVVGWMGKTRGWLGHGRLGGGGGGGGVI